MLTVNMIFSQMRETEKSKKVSDIRVKCLNHLTLVRKKLDLFSSFNKNELCQLFFPKLMEKSEGYYNNKAFFDYLLEDNKKTFNSILKYCGKVLQWIEQTKQEEITLEVLYDFVVEFQMLLSYIKQDNYSELKSRVINIPYEQVQAEIENGLLEINLFCKDFLDLLEEGIETRQKNYWKYVEAVVTFENNEWFFGRNVKMSTFAEKTSKIHLSVFNKIKNEALREAEPLTIQLLTKLNVIDEKNQKLSRERIEQRLSGKTVFSVESTRAVFYALYDSLEEILMISKEFDDGLKILKENIKQIAEQKNREQTAQTAKTFEEARKKKLEEYKKSILQEKEKRSLSSKRIHQDFAISKGATRKITGSVQEKINQCSDDDLHLIQDILKNNNNILIESVDALLVNLGFSSRPTTDQGCLFTLGKNFTISYHKKHASNAEASKIDQSFVNQLRKIFWELGINEELIKLSLSSRAIKQSQKKKDTEGKKEAQKEKKTKKKTRAR